MAKLFSDIYVCVFVCLVQLSYMYRWHNGQECGTCYDVPGHFKQLSHDLNSLFARLSAVLLLIETRITLSCREELLRKEGPLEIASLMYRKAHTAS